MYVLTTTVHSCVSARVHTCTHMCAGVHVCAYDNLDVSPRLAAQGVVGINLFTSPVLGFCVGSGAPA